MDKRNRNNGVTDIPDSIYECDRIYRERIDRPRTQMDLVDNSGHRRCDYWNYRDDTEEVEEMRLNMVLGAILIAIGIFGFIMAIITFPW